MKHPLFSLMFALLLTAICISQPVAQTKKAKPDPFGDKVRDYLLANPEVILEAMELLGVRQEKEKVAKLVAPHYTDLLSTDAGLTIGDVDAPTKIIEFFDYRCAVCKAAVPRLRKIVKDDPDIVFIKKHLAILTPASERTARYVLAANMVYGAASYEKLHQALYAGSKPMIQATFKENAELLGLDHALIAAKVDDEAVSKIIDRHRDIAIELGFRGTPIFMGPRGFKAGVVNAEDIKKLTLGG